MGKGKLKALARSTPSWIYLMLTSADFKEMLEFFMGMSGISTWKLWLKTISCKSSHKIHRAAELFTSLTTKSVVCSGRDSLLHTGIYKEL